MLHDVGFLLSRVCKCVESLVEKVPEISQSMKEELHLIRSAVEEPSVQISPLQTPKSLHNYCQLSY
jgi:hypothetical protein